MEEGYAPTSRRPIADVFRATARRAVAWCVSQGIHPDVISYASIGFALLAAGCFVGARWQPWLLLVAPLPCYARLWLNMLDGMVALAAGKAGRRGEIVNDLPDRVSDVVIFAGVAHGGLVEPSVAYWAALMAVMTAYVGITGQAVGAGRQYGGLMSKPWRMVVLHAGAWATWGLLAAGVAPRVGRMTVLDVACGIVIVGCVQTCVVRLRRILQQIEKES